MTPRPRQCSDLNGDRRLGEYWEQQFCILAAQYGRSFTRHQFRKSEAANAYRLEGQRYHSVLLPDITVWSAPGEHHEIKHKDPTRDGYFGLEKYRLDALVWFARETKQSVLYTIHNHKLAGGRDVKANRLQDWMTANVIDLEYSYEKEDYGDTWCRGETIQVKRLYWPVGLWIPLEDAWDAQLWPENLEDGVIN